MAKTLYFTRHGETFWNVENKICGATDIALTPKGEEQAAALGRRLREMALPIDLVLASPLCRAAETARILGREAGLPVEVEPRLTEQNFGVTSSSSANCSRVYPRNSRCLRILPPIAFQSIAPLRFSSV